MTQDDSDPRGPAPSPRARPAPQALSAEALTACVGLTYCAAATRRAALSAGGSSLPAATCLWVLAASQYCVLALVLSTLSARQLQSRRRPCVQWGMPPLAAAAAAYVCLAVGDSSPAPGSLLWLAASWILRARWLALAMLSTSVPQPADKHGAGLFLTTFVFHAAIISELLHSPELERCQSVIWESHALAAGDKAPLQGGVLQLAERTLAGLRAGGSELAYKALDAACQLLVAYGWPCFLLYRWEWQQRVAPRQLSPEAGPRQGTLASSLLRMLGAAGIMALEVTIITLLFS